jgi:hypothetical protein
VDEQKTYINMPVLIKNPSGVHNLKSNWRYLKPYAGADDTSENMGWGATNGLTIIDDTVFIVHPRREDTYRIGWLVVAADQEILKARLLQLSNEAQKADMQDWELSVAAHSATK